MAIAVPILDDRAYADLVEEARGLIPVYDPSWTNHNASDPGITLIELFAWLTEMQIYALDQITDEHRVTFLRLLNGPDLKPKRNPHDGTIDPDWLDAETARTLDMLRTPSRAVSAGDHEVIAYQVPGVTRAKCVPRRNLDAGTEPERRVLAEGHVSVVILPDEDLLNSTATFTAVQGKLEDGRMLTTRLHVVAPTWVPVSTRIVVARRADNLPEDLAPRIRTRVAEWLSAWHGGKDGKGWPFGQDVYVSELNAVLEGVRGVDYVGDTLLDSKTTPTKPLEPPADPIWHDNGALIGLALAPHHLPRSPKEAHDVLVADMLEPVAFTVHITPGQATLPDARRAVSQALNETLWQLQYGAYKQDASFDLSEDAITRALKDASQIGGVTINTVEIKAKRSAENNTATPTYRFQRGQFFHATCKVVVP